MRSVVLWVDGALSATSEAPPIMTLVFHGSVLGADDKLTLEIVPYR